MAVTVQRSLHFLSTSSDQRFNMTMLLRASIILFAAVIGLTYSDELNERESSEWSAEFDLEYRPWIHDDKSANWISVDGMGITKINSTFQVNVPNLEWLVMDNNRIARIPSESFKFLPNLTYVSLSNNQIGELAFDAFSNLDKLQVIDLDRNPIGSSKFDTRVFETLPALEQLYLRKCGIQDFNPSQHIKNLTHLHLSDNELQFFYASSESELTHLYLDNNQLNYISLAYFKSLVFLNVSNNWLGQIVSHFPMSSAHFARTFGRSNVWNRPSNAVLCLAYAPALQYLIASSNRISEIAPDAFFGTERLTHVDLSRNEISSVHAGTFNNLLHLESILLDSNRISEINYRAFANLPNLKIISLKHNKITDISEDAFTKLDSAANRIELFLDNNEIHTLRSRAFQGIQGLKHIGLSNNKIKTISSKAFMDLPNLESLVIENQSRNETSDRDGGAMWDQVTTPTSPTKGLIESDAFYNLSNLTSIIIRGNVFTDIQAQAFHDLPALTTLDLSNNSIEYLSSQAFANLSAIEYLYLDQNLIPNIKPETFPNQLKALNLAHNPLCPDFRCWHIDDLQQLEKLNVSGVISYFTIDDVTALPPSLIVVVG